MSTAVQFHLPASGPAREALRQKGQFWTPDWVAQAMVAYVLGGGATTLFDPAVGAGAFFRAARALRLSVGDVALCGTELDPRVLQDAQESGLPPEDLAGVEIRDFILTPTSDRFPAIVANPPYLRHHRLTREVKDHCRRLGARVIGRALDGRAGLHVYFLLTALQMLEPGGRLAFIMPADVCEGVFAKRLWRWIASNYRLDGVVTFAPAASPFPRVDTNPLILMIRHAPPRDEFHWARCEQAETPALLEWARSVGEATTNGDMTTCLRSVEEALLTGLSRPPREGGDTGPVLADFARVVRGIATGANDFFHVFPSWARDAGISEEFLVRAVGRTRDLEGDEITAADLLRLDAAGRPTALLCLDGRPQDQFPEAVREYLAVGEGRGLDLRPLIHTRRPWYKMEHRDPPPFLFAYLGRRSARFVRNRAGVVPLSGFLCVFPHLSDPDYVERLWQVLRDPRTVANLALVGKSYGGGAIKVEPRALETLPIPTDVLAEAHLKPPGRAGQTSLFESA